MKTIYIEHIRLHLSNYYPKPNQLRKLLWLSCLLSSFSSYAQLGGNSVYNTFNITSSARIAALGGNAIATIDDDLNLAIYNPSLLDSSMNEQLALSYVDYFAKTNFGFASYAKYIPNVATFSGTVQFFNYGQFDETDAGGNTIGTFRASDIGITLGASNRIDSSFTVGANVKLLYSTIDKYNSLGAAVDLAGTYENKVKGLTAALVFKNLGYQLWAYSEKNREKLPFEIQLGISQKLKHAPFRFSVIAENIQQWDLTYVNSNEPVQIDPITGVVTQKNNFKFGDQLMRHLVFGGEMLLSSNFNIRFGYNYRMRQEMKIQDKPGTAGFSWGLGFGVNKFRFSYARAIYHLAGPSNHFTIVTRLSDW